jgi:signal transduction histidine kinase
MIHRLRDVSALALSQPCDGDVHQKMLRQVGEVMRVETSALVLREGAQQEWQLHAVAELDEKLESALRSALKSPDGQKTVERVAQSERPLVIRGWLTRTTGERRPEKSFTLAGAPLVVGKHKVGVILVATRRPRHFSTDELLLLQLVAERLTVAVGLTQLYKREQQARLQAENNSRIRDEFLNTLSHEIRTPLNSILGWISLLRAGRLNEEQTEHALTTIERSARLQSQLINDLVDLSAAFDGKASLDLSPVQPEGLVAKAVEATRPAAEARQINLEVSFEATGDANAGPVLADPDKLRQIVSHLLSNAIKFTPENGRVQVRVQRVDQHLEIIVSDNGVGIQPEFLPFVFERFSQADSSNTRRYGGLGLGLALVRQLVELHDGTVSVESAGENQGTKFVVRLPLEIKQEHQQVQPLLPLFEELEDKSQDLSGLHVLVVDDDYDSRQLVSTILSHCQAEARTAEGANEALAMLEAWQPDVLISDLTMPGMNGFELIDKCAHERRGLSTRRWLSR